MAKPYFGVFEPIAPIVQQTTQRQANPVVVGKTRLEGWDSGRKLGFRYRAKNRAALAFPRETGSKVVAGSAQKPALLPPLGVAR